MPGFTYKSYNFTDKDPIIDYLRTVINNSNMTIKHIADQSGVNQLTIANWLYGETKKPQAATLNAVLRVLGHKLDITHISAPMLIQPTPYVPQAVDRSAPKKRMGAVKYVNVHRIAHRIKAK